MTMLRLMVALCLLAQFAVSAYGDTQEIHALLGFSTDGAARERALEARFDGLLKKDEMREWMKRLSARPHHVGSPYLRENTEFIAGLFRSWGYDTQIEEFQ